VAIVSGDVRHTGTLVTMDYDYEVDSKGTQSRHEVELGVLRETYTAAGQLWHIDWVDFYLSTLDLSEVPEDVGFSRDGIDRPWVRLRDIRLNVNDLKKMDAASPRQLGASGAPRRINWDRFWSELICRLYEDGTPQDDDQDWRPLTAELRRTFVGEIDELLYPNEDADIAEAASGSRSHKAIRRRLS
jgi:hypothetical protein